MELHSAAFAGKRMKKPYEQRVAIPRLLRDWQRYLLTALACAATVNQRLHGNGLVETLGCILGLSQQAASSLTRFWQSVSVGRQPNDHGGCRHP